MASASWCLVAVLLAFASVASADILVSNLYGSNVIGTADPPTANGDLDGSAEATVTIDGGRICLMVTWRNLATVTRYHLHQGADGVRGPVVINWVDESTPNAFPMNNGNSVTTCAINNAINNTPPVTQALIDDILANPAGYYLDLHTPETRVNFNNQTISYQATSAVRGQLVAVTGCRAAGLDECGNTKETLSCCNRSTQMCVSNTCVNK